MRIVTAGILHGDVVELDEKVTLPNGAYVQVTLEPRALSLDQKRKLALELCGAWASDKSLDSVFRTIELDRLRVLGGSA